MAYVLGKVEALHKTTCVSSDGSEVRVKSLVVTRDTYLGREVLSIPNVGEWIRGVLEIECNVVKFASTYEQAGYEDMQEGLERDGVEVGVLHGEEILSMTNKPSATAAACLK